MVLDSYHYDWEAELGQIVMASFIQAGASTAARAYARLAHDSLVVQLNASAAGGLTEVPPLVEYDPTRALRPFALVDAGSIPPMECSPGAKECWRRKCDAQLFRRYRPPAPTSAEGGEDGGVAGGGEGVHEVTYEELTQAKGADGKGGTKAAICADK